MDRNRPLSLGVNVLLLLVLGLVLALAPRGLGADRISWTQAKADIQSGLVDQVQIDGALVHLRYKATEDGAPTRQIDVGLVSGDEGFIPLLEQKGAGADHRLLGHALPP